MLFMTIRRGKFWKCCKI